jgi:RNA polymerase sigma factor (sigma-70 family)
MNQHNMNDSSSQLKISSLPNYSDLSNPFRQYLDADPKKLMFENAISRVLKAVIPYSRYLCTTDLNDLFQEGCLGLLEAINDFDKSCHESFSQFADRSIYRRLKRFWRQQIHTERFLPKFVSIETERLESANNTCAEQEERYLSVRQALFSLSPKQKLVIERVYGFHGLPASLSQIAAEYEVSHEAIRKTHIRGLVNLSQNPDVQALVP